MVEDDEEHGERAEEDGELVEIIVGDHGGGSSTGRYGVETVNCAICESGCGGSQLIC